MFERSPEVEESLAKAKGATKHMLLGATMSGITGAAMGAVLAVLRNESAKFYAVSMGSNFFILSSTYIVFEEVIADKRDDKKNWVTGAAAGAMTGGFYAGLVGGPFRGIQGAAAGAAVGASVVFGREGFHTWRLSKGVQRYKAKYGEAPAIYHPETAALLKSQGPPRKLEFPSLLPQSIKISKEDIERRIVIRMNELRKEMLDDDKAAALEEENKQNKLVKNQDTCER